MSMRTLEEGQPSTLAVQGQGGPAPAALDLSLRHDLLAHFDGQSVGWHDLAPELVRRIPHICGVEVGVWQASLSRALIELCGVQSLTLVDEWIIRRFCTGETVETFGPGYSQDEMEQSFLLVRYWAAGHPGKVKIYRASSISGTQFVPDASQDFVIIDASHDLNSVRDDIDAWWPKVRVGGVLLGDDIGALFPGVEQAVRERFGEAAQVIGPMWWITK